jgi:HEAT repeat protein/tetratricopeptide (TPR) repeat protein
MASHDITELLFHLSSNDYKIKISAVNELGKVSSIEAYEALKLLYKKNDAVLRPHVKSALADIEESLKKNNIEILDKLTGAVQFEKKSPGLNYDIFINYLNDEEVKNRISVLAACSKIGRDSRLEQILTDRLSIEEHPFVKASLLINLGRVGSPDCVDIIASFLSDPDARIRANAVEGLDNLQTPETAAYILSAASDSDARVAANAARALINVDGQYVETQLRSMLDSGDQARVEAARFVIEKVKIKIKNYILDETGGPQKVKAKSGPAESGGYPVNAGDKTSKKDISAAGVSKSHIQQDGGENKIKIKNYIILFTISLTAFYIYFTYFNKTNIIQPGVSETAYDGNEYSSYEVELKSKVNSVIAEIERFIDEKNAQEIFLKLVQLKKMKSDHDLIKIFEAEIKVLGNDYREALIILKQAPPETKSLARYHYLNALCFFYIDNLAEADFFCAQAQRIRPAGKYYNSAAALGGEIKKIRDQRNADALKETKMFFDLFYGLLNEEGPRALRHYFFSKNYYDLFEGSWRRVLLEVKQWKIDYEIVDVELIISKSANNIINAKILEKCQYQNYGGICGINYSYKDFYLFRTPQGYSFDTGSVSVPLLIKEFDAAAFNADRPRPFEDKYIKELTFVNALEMYNSDYTSAAELLKSIYQKSPGFAPALAELLLKSNSFDKKELDALRGKIKKTPPASADFDFFSGGLNLKSTLLNYIADAFLDCGDTAVYKAILDEIIAENNAYANAHFEKAIYYKKNGEEQKCLKSVEAALKIEPDFPSLDSYFWPSQYGANQEIITRAGESFNQGLIDDLEKLIKEEPLYWRTYFNAGKLMLVLEAYEEASLFFETALALSPDNCSILTKLAFCSYKLNDFKRAKEYSSKAKKIEPHNFQVKRAEAMFLK